MPTNYLPKLKTGTANRLDLPHVVGSWSDGQAKTRLHSLANAIEVQPGATNIHSIPDPWARIILFGRALFDETHVLHQKTLGEWRGVLAILGLKEMRRFNELAVRAVSLDLAAQATGTFSYAVARVLPSQADAISTTASWKRFNLLLWHGEKTGRVARAFGLTSPSTLVATGSFYDDVIDTKEVPWFVDGVLVDPTQEHLSQSEKSALAQWLLHVRTGIAKIEVGDEGRHGRILTYLEDYALDLSPTERLRVPEEVLSDAPIGLDGAELYSVLNHPHRSASRVISDVRIVTDRPGAPDYVLIDQALSDALKRPERDITIHRNVNLFTADRHLQDLKKQKSGVFPSEGGVTTRAAAAPIRWCTADFFFQSQLIYEQLGAGAGAAGADDSFPGCLMVRTEGQSAGRNAAFPLTEEAAKLFTPEYLARNFLLKWLRPGDKDSPIAKATLRLQVEQKLDGAAGTAPVPAQKAASGSTHWVTIEHDYFDSDKCRVTNLPALCIWPNFRFEDEVVEEHPGTNTPPVIKNRWSRYYLFESWRGQSGSDNFVVTPLSGQPGDSRPPQRDKGEYFQVTVLPKFPDVLVCQMPFGDDKPRSNDSRPPKGLLLLDLPKATPPQDNHSAALGIDFGTTGTSIYRAFGVDEAAVNEREDVASVNLNNRIFPVTGYDANEFQRLTRDLFLPADLRSTGNILSIFQDFSGKGDRVAVRDGHVLFVSELVGNTFIAGEPGSIRSNLKWGTDRQNVAARDFLTQLCMQSMAEVVLEGATSIDIRYSYPTAFSEDDIEWFNAIWNGVVRQVRTITSIPITGNEAGVDNCEAVAATRFFAHGANATRLNVARGAITLDIGGGTTDIAVWNRDPETTRPTLLAHLSVLFAGKDIFLTVLRERPDLLTIIDDDAHYTMGAVEVLKQLPKGGQAYNAELDATISKFGQRLMDRLGDKAREENVKEFIGILELGLCGIAFYTGLLVGQLVEAGTYDEMQSHIPVFVGGNGSKLLQWCAFGKMGKESKISRLFANSLLAGAQIAAGDKFKGKVVDVHPSPRPKEEVAYGLVVRARPLARNDSFLNPPAGENYWVGPKSSREIKDWKNAPDIEVLRTKPVQVDPKLEIFHKFLDSMNIKLNEEELYNVADAVDRELYELAEAAKAATSNGASEGAKDSVRKQPMFIMALKHLVTEKINRLVAHA